MGKCPKWGNDPIVPQIEPPNQWLYLLSFSDFSSSRILKSINDDYMEVDSDLAVTKSQENATV